MPISVFVDGPAGHDKCSAAAATANYRPIVEIYCPSAQIIETRPGRGLTDPDFTRALDGAGDLVHHAGARPGAVPAAVGKHENVTRFIDRTAVNIKNARAVWMIPQKNAATEYVQRAIVQCVNSSGIDARAQKHPTVHI